MAASGRIRARLQPAAEGKPAENRRSCSEAGGQPGEAERGPGAVSGPAERYPGRRRQGGPGLPSAQEPRWVDEVVTAAPLSVAVGDARAGSRSDRSTPVVPIPT